MNPDEKKIVYNEMVGKRSDGTIVFLDYVFDKGNGFKDATGTGFVPVTADEKKERIENYDFEETWREQVKEKMTYLGLEEFTEFSKEEWENDFFFNLGYSHLWDEIRETFPEYADKEKYPLFECTIWGRIFSSEDKWEIIVNPDLIPVIESYETKEDATNE